MPNEHGISKAISIRDLMKTLAEADTLDAEVVIRMNNSDPLGATSVEFDADSRLVVSFEVGK